MSIEIAGTAKHFETNLTFLEILFCPNNLSEEKDAT